MKCERRGLHVVLEYGMSGRHHLALPMAYRTGEYDNCSPLATDEGCYAIQAAAVSIIKRWGDER